MKNIYGIYDIVVKRYINKFESTEDADAIRSYKTDIVKAQNERVPVKDFMLVKLGTFDYSTGILTSDIKVLVEAINKDEPGRI